MKCSIKDCNEEVIGTHYDDTLNPPEEYGLCKHHMKIFCDWFWNGN